MLLFVEIKEILSWTIFGQILEELVENITGNSRMTIMGNFWKHFIIYLEHYKKLLWKLQKILEKICVNVDSF